MKKTSLIRKTRFGNAVFLEAEPVDPKSLGTDWLMRADGAYLISAQTSYKNHPDVELAVLERFRSRGAGELGHGAYAHRVLLDPATARALARAILKDADRAAKVRAGKKRKGAKR